ncbi:MAG: hypothetical protein U0736_19740 [Gemmataceae bacterium]
MRRPVRWRRVWLGGGTVLALIAVALIAARVYLSSRSAARMVAGHLAGLFHTDVSIDRLHGALVGDSVLTGLTLREADGDDPYFQADRLVANLSVWRAMWGARLPDRVEIDGPWMRLRFDRDGKLLTRLPKLPFTGKLPNIRIRAARLTLEQVGREPFTVENGTVDIRPLPADNLTGTIDDPVWGRFVLTGHLGRDVLTVAVTSDAFRADMGMLRTVPFVQPQTWQRVEAEAEDAYVRLTLRVQKVVPQVRYRVEFDRVTVRLPQKDRPPLSVRPARGWFEGDVNGLSAHGEVDDQVWGKWTARVGFVPKSRDLTINLTSDDVRFDPAKLAGLPYVPAGVWRQVTAAGRGAVRLVVRLHGPTPELRYRLDVKVRDTRLQIATIHLDVDDVTGEMTVEDGRIQVHKAAGRTASGRIEATSAMDFRAAPAVLQFDLDVRGLRMRQLPPAWALPSQVDGSLTGTAWLRVTLKPGAVQTHGSGSGRIDEARLVGFPTREPVRLTLRADGKRFRFVPEMPLLKGLLSGWSRLTGAAQPAAAGRPSPGWHAARGGAVDALAGGIARAGAAAARGAAGVGRATALNRLAGPTQLDVRWAMDDVDPGALTERLGYRLPFTVSGPMAVRIGLTIPVDAARDLRGYRLEGTIEAARLSIGATTIAGLEARVSYAEGRLQLRSVRGEVRAAGRGTAGRFAGAAEAQLVPRGPAGFDLTLTDLPLEAVGAFVAAARGRLGGRVSGRLRGAVPLDLAGDPSAWRGQGVLVCPAANLFGQPIAEAATGVCLEGGQLRLLDVRGRCCGGAVAGSATLELARPYHLMADATMRGGDLAALQLPLASDLPRAGTIDLSAVVRVPLTDPTAVTGTGTARAAAVRLGGVRVDELAGGLRFEKGRLTLHDLTSRLYGGVVSGTASLVLAGLLGELDLHLDALDVAALTGLGESSGVRLQGKLSGQVGASVRLGGNPAGPVNAGLHTADGFVNLTVPEVRLQGVTARQLRGAIEFRDGKIGYRARGEALGGTFSVEGSYPPPPFGSVSQPHGWLRVERVGLNPLTQAVAGRDRLPTVSGTLSFSLPFRHDGPDWLPVGRGPFEVRDLRLADTEWAEVVRGDVRLGGDGVLVRDVSGIVGGGQLRLSGRYSFRDPARSWFDARLARLELPRLLPGGHDLRGLVDGPLDLAVRGTLGAEWHGSGSVSLTRGKVFGVEVSDVRLPLEFTHAPQRGQGELAVHEGGGQVGQGRAQLRAILNWGNGLKLDGSVRLFDAALHRLGGLLGEASTYARGQVNGRVDFAARDLRSLADVTANLQASLRSAQALQLPVLQALVPYLVPGQGAVEFTTGEVKGRLSGGVFRIAELTLESPLVQLFLEGNVTVAGRLDLDVLAQTTKTGVNPVVLRLLLKALPPVGPVPLVVLLRANDILSDRVVRLRVGGTLKAPRVQVEPLRLLSEQAVRFFLTEALRSSAK